MLDENGVQNLFDQINKLWIEREISRRKEAGRLPKDFRIFRCLIRLPQDSPPIVEFNNEIGWIVSVEKAPGTAFKKGQPVFLHEIQKIEAVSPPEVNGQRVAFIYLFWTGSSYQIVVDFTPNVPEGMISKEEKEAWLLGKTIAESLQAILIEKTIHIHDKIQIQLQNIGLWAAPALLPYPMSKIAKELEEGDIEDARTTFVAYCTSEYIEELSSKWWNVEEFKKRNKLIHEALDAHKEGRWQLSIHALLPQIEGIITDWIYTKLPEKEIPWRQESKTKRFRDLVLERPPTTFTYKRIVESAIDFILGGPVLKTFKKWVEQINQAFPNRHVVEHGKYDESLFTEENSVKLFLLIDTLYHIISSQSERGDSSHGSDR
jgi:hypothetical protein